MAETLPPSIDQIAALAEAALATIPADLRRHVEGVRMLVEEFCDEETEREMELQSPYDLLGLYRGVSLDQKSSGAIAPEPDAVWLYRQPILAYWCETGEPLERIVRHLVIHEIGHHFGFSDEQMELLEQQSDALAED